MGMTRPRSSSASPATCRLSKPCALRREALLPSSSDIEQPVPFSWIPQCPATLAAPALPATGTLPGPLPRRKGSSSPVDLHPKMLVKPSGLSAPNAVDETGGGGARREKKARGNPPPFFEEVAGPSRELS